MASEPPINRRSFFRRGLGELLRPIAGALDAAERVARETAKLSDLEKTPVTPLLRGGSPVLRPPGALAEADFLTACESAGQCVNACPANSIRVEPNGRGGGKPFIDANLMACVVCDGLYCMHACPSGALKPTPLVQIDMGTAVWHAGSCVRASGQECTICIDRCPLGDAAIGLDTGRIVVKDGCIGCGVCQHECPTDPPSILVIPASARRR